MTTNGCPARSPASMTFTMWGWLSWTSERISRANRSRNSGPAAASSRTGELQDDVGLQVAIVRQVDAAHVPLADPAEDLVTPSATSMPTHSPTSDATMPPKPKPGRACVWADRPIASERCGDFVNKSRRDDVGSVDGSECPAGGQGGGVTAARAGLMGRTRRKPHPEPGLLSTSIRPPWPATIAWVTLRPSPRPLPIGLVVKNGSKIPGEGLGRDTDAVVPDLDDDLLAGASGGDDDPAVGAAGLLDGGDGVGQEVEQCLVQVGRGGLERRQLAGPAIHRDPQPVDVLVQQDQALIDRLVDVKVPDRRAGRAGRNRGAARRPGRRG